MAENSGVNRGPVPQIVRQLLIPSWCLIEEREKHLSLLDPDSQNTKERGFCKSPLSQKSAALDLGRKTGFFCCCKITEERV